jgi:hypothetical protein
VGRLTILLVRFVFGRLYVRVCVFVCGGIPAYAAPCRIGLLVDGLAGGNSAIALLGSPISSVLFCSVRGRENPDFCVFLSSFHVLVSKPNLRPPPAQSTVHVSLSALAHAVMVSFPSPRASGACWDSLVSPCPLTRLLIVGYIASMFT